MTEHILGQRILRHTFHLPAYHIINTLLYIFAVEYLNNLINEGINNTECICSAARCRDDGERGPRIGIALLETINTDLPG